jgi:hypothetical protein
VLGGLISIPGGRGISPSQGGSGRIHAYDTGLLIQMKLMIEDAGRRLRSKASTKFIERTAKPAWKRLSEKG